MISDEYAKFLELKKFNNPVIISDESEPTFHENDHTSSSSDVILSDEETNFKSKLERKTSISLGNVSTPYPSKAKKCRFRSVSHYNIDSDSQNKPKRKKYDHVESKVKQYRMKIRQETEEHRKLLRQKEEQIKKELENNLLKCSPNLSISSDLKNNLSLFSPSVNNSCDENEEIGDIESPKELVEKYERALSEIKTLQFEIRKLKATKSGTPRTVVKKRLQTSMIKTCLFRNSSTSLRPDNLQNATRSTLFENDSTCRTIDIDDVISPIQTDKISNGSDFIVVENNPFLVRAESHVAENNPFLVTFESPVAETTVNSSVPLLPNYENSESTCRQSIYKFLNNVFKFPSCKVLPKLKKNRNKVGPNPNIFIISPKSEDMKLKEFNNLRSETTLNFARTYNKYIEENSVSTGTQEKLIIEMSECCDKLIQQCTRFKTLGNECLNIKCNNNNNN